MVVTSPPYWDILIEKRPLYPKENANYGDTDNDLGKLVDYHQFLSELKAVFEQVTNVSGNEAGYLLLYCCNGYTARKSSLPITHGHINVSSRQDLMAFSSTLV